MIINYIDNNLTTKQEKLVSVSVITQLKKLHNNHVFH